jgi:hypothetical protein
MGGQVSKDVVREAKRALADRIREVRGVTSLGIGGSRKKGGYFVRVTVEDEKSAHSIPSEISGVPVQVSVSGPFIAYSH